MLGQAQLDPAVLLESGFGLVRIKRLPLAKTSSGKMARRNTLVDEVTHDGNCARGRKLPVRRVSRALEDWTIIRVTIDFEDPIDVRWDLSADLAQGRDKWRQALSRLRA